MNPFHRSTVLKDPTGKFVAEYLHREFEVRPVIVVRHPASLASSLKRVGWWPEMESLKRRYPTLLEDYFQDDTSFLRTTWSSPMLEAMAHWRATYKVLLQQASKYDDWIVLTHEDVCRRPVESFRHVYRSLGLPWSRPVEWWIRMLTGADSARAEGNQAMDLSRDSSSIFELRRDALDVETRRVIFELTKDVSLELYSQDSFALD
jgi:hypothetical protein